MKKKSISSKLPENVRFRAEAVDDLNALDGSQKPLVIKAIIKAAKNPQPKKEGGYGEPLGNRDGYDLTGYMKLKIRDAGIRIVYQYIRTDHGMEIIVISMRADSEVYRIAYNRTH